MAEVNAASSNDQLVQKKHVKSKPSDDVLPKKGLSQIISLHALSINQVSLATIALILFLHLGALTLFSRGFLLNRTTLEKRNTCNPTQPECSLPAKFDRAVILLVDALRYDFLLPIDPTSPQYNPSHHNLLTVPLKLTEQYPSNSLLYKSIADPPTTTLQRLKAITTGSLPTFIDAGSNFAGSKVEEDNWLEQANRAGKRIAFMGDDTWLTIFPESIFAVNHSFPFDSFNVEDLDTVDQGVRDHILPFLDQPPSSSSWDILIGHPLGLDHAGHRFGASHSETTRKLNEIDELLDKIVKKLGDRDLLVVMGDHGMDFKGDHGGDSPEETDAGLWLYSRTPLVPSGALQTKPFSATSESLEEILLHAPDNGEATEFFAQDGQMKRSVPQISLVPSLSLLLGLPLPFNNLGTLIPELFLDTASGSAKRLVEALRINAAQIQAYLTEYAAHSSGSDLAPFVPELLQLYTAATLSSDDLEQFLAYRDFTYATLKQTRAIWARFDSVLMAIGIAVLFGTLLVLVHLYRQSKAPGCLWRGGKLRVALSRSLMGLLFGLASSISVAIVSGFLSRPIPYISTANFILTSACVAAQAGVLSTYWKIGNSSTHKKWSSQTYLALTIITAHCASFASNSFTMWEDAVTLYLIQLGTLLLLIRALQAPESRLRKRIAIFSLLFMLLNRLMSFSSICREEQHPYCTATFYGGSGTSISSLPTILAAVLSAIILPAIVGMFLNISDSRKGWSPFFLRYTLRSLLFGGALYWAADYLEHFGDHGMADLCITFKVAMARITLLCSILVGTTIWYASPLCIDVQQRTNVDQTGKPVTQITVIGFANSIGSYYLLVFLALFGGLFLLAQPVGQIVLAAGLIGLLCILEALDSAQDSEKLRESIESIGIEGADLGGVQPVANLSPPSFLSISIVCLLGFILFFATGHQAVLSAIQWKTAFVGFPTLTYPFSPLLVVLNTLGPFIISAAAIPLIIYWNVTPSLKNGPTIPLLSNLVNVSLGFLLYHTAITLSSAIFASHLRRHLMVWKVFAPRFMLSALTLLIVDITILIFSIGWGGLGTLRKLQKTFGTAWS